ncbi:MAG: hypothetical protein IKG46_07840 [Solobacterium sp.]|nr:hypothetical protein [Solobacterium sp.]
MKQKETKFLIALVIILLVITGAVVWHENEIYKKEQAHKAALEKLAAELQEDRALVSEINETSLSALEKKAEQQKDPAYHEQVVRTTQLPVNAVGDSVMLDAVPLLQSTFPNGYFDAEVSRSHYPLLDILSSRSYAGILGDPVVIAIGTNNPLPLQAAQQAVELCGDRQVFWLTTTNNWQFNNTDTILSLAETYDNVTVIDWDKASDDHPEYFVWDGIHLTEEGSAAYVQLIRDAVTERLFALRPEEKAGTLLIGDDRLVQTAKYLRDAGEICYLAGDDLSPETVRSYLEDLQNRDIHLRNVLLASDNTDLRNCVAEVFPEYHEITIDAKPEDLAADGIHLTDIAAEKLAGQIRTMIDTAE